MQDLLCVDFVFKGQILYVVVIKHYPLRQFLIVQVIRGLYQDMKLSETVLLDVI